MSMDEMMTILNKKSGVLGISGVSSDFRDLEQRRRWRAISVPRWPLEVFEYGVKQDDRLPTLPPWAGWTPSCSPPAWARTPPTCVWHIVSGLEFMGIEDRPREEQHPRQGDALSPPTAPRSKVLVIPTNEELMIAKDTAELVG